MAETVKKTKSSATPGKTAKAKSAPDVPATKKSAATNHTVKRASRKKTAEVIAMPAPTHEQIAELARKFWAERGYVDGYHEDDWFRAEQALRFKAS